MERGLLNLVAEPKLIRATIEKIGDFLERYYENLASAASGSADILGFGDDFAGQTGLLLNPEFWRIYFLHLWKKLFAIGHKYNLKVMMHLCGGIREVIPDLIDIGLDIYENLQTTGPGMEAAEVKEYVKRMIELMSKDGGYISASTHFLLDDIPARNVIAMYEAAGSLL